MTDHKSTLADWIATIAALFSLILFGLFIFSVYYVSWTLPPWVEQQFVLDRMQNWPSTSASVLNCREVDPHRGRDYTGVTYEYIVTVDGVKTTFTDSEDLLHSTCYQYQDSNITIHYNPQRPQTTVMANADPDPHGMTLLWLFALGVPVLIIVLSIVLYVVERIEVFQNKVADYLGRGGV